MLKFAFLLFFLTLFVSCQSTETGDPGIVDAYARVDGDVWAYTDGAHSALVGSGFAEMELFVLGVPAGAIWPELPSQAEFGESTAWFKSPDEERSQLIGEPWPWWMESRVRPQDLTRIELRWGSISFESPPAPPEYTGPEDTVPEPADPLSE